MSRCIFRGTSGPTPRPEGFQGQPLWTPRLFRPQCGANCPCARGGPFNSGPKRPSDKNGPEIPLPPEQLRNGSHTYGPSSIQLNPVPRAGPCGEDGCLKGWWCTAGGWGRITFCNCMCRGGFQTHPLFPFVVAFDDSAA